MCYTDAFLRIVVIEEEFYKSDYTVKFSSAIEFVNNIFQFFESFVISEFVVI